MNKTENGLVTRRYLITGAKRVSNYWWAFIVSFGGFAFFLTGFASFFQRGIFLFNQSKSISFFPQGLIMCFYGCLGLFFGFYLWCTIFWRVGDGFNEFNQNQGFVRIFRWGLPGKNRRIDFQYKMDEIEGVRVELKEGVNPRRTISLKIKGGVGKVGLNDVLNKKATVFVAPSANDSDSRQTETSCTAGTKSVAKSKILHREEASLLPGTEFRYKKSSNNKRSPGKASSNRSRSFTDREKGNKRDAFTVPLTRVGQPISLEKIESQASELAQFLRVSLETSYLD